MREQVDLIVEGGGPAGSTLAALAAQAGVKTLVLERARLPRDKVCGEFLAAEGCQVLERLGVLGALRDAGGSCIDSCRLTNRRGVGFVAPLPELAPDGRDALGVSRSLLDVTLLDLASRSGASVRQAREVSGVEGADGRVCGVRARRVGARGAEERLSARLVVAAGGRRSLLARQIQRRRTDPGRTHRDSWFGLKVHLDGHPARLEGRVELHLFDGGYAGLAAIEDGRMNLCLLVRAGALRACGGSPARLLEERIQANPAARAVLDGARPCAPWHSVGPLRFGPRQAAAAGVLFVGDAAGTVDPFCGEGMSLALRAAELALPFVLAALASGGLHDYQARAWQRAWSRAFLPLTRRARVLGTLLGRPLLADAGLALLAGRVRGLAPRLVAATRSQSGLR